LVVGQSHKLHLQDASFIIAEAHLNLTSEAVPLTEANGQRRTAKDERPTTNDERPTTNGQRPTTS